MTDVAIIGGGILGLATAFELARTRSLGVILLEKETRLATHQTGRNSGVLHSGIYYRPGSAKARLCVAGADLMKTFCRERGIRFELCGKLVVAVSEAEVPKLLELHRRGTENGVAGLRLVGPDGIHDIEPHAVGVKALHVPTAGIIDFVEVANALAVAASEAGVDIRTGQRVEALRQDGDVVVETSNTTLRARYLITCAGLHSDRVTRMEGADPGARIVPFRGEYYEVVPDRRHLVRALIYPVPDPRFPFLGVHFTRSIHGGVEAGPNAVLALKREGYRKRDVAVRDALEVFAYPGFWRLAARYWRTGIGEVVRSLLKSAFVRALSRLVPEIRSQDLVPSAAGVRAQALAPTGDLVDDFWIIDRPRALHVVNAPSPAATASLAIAREVVRMASARFDLGKGRS